MGVGNYYWLVIFGIELVLIWKCAMKLKFIPDGGDFIVLGMCQIGVGLCAGLRLVDEECC